MPSLLCEEFQGYSMETETQMELREETELGVQKVKELRVHMTEYWTAARLPEIFRGSPSNLQQSTKQQICVRKV